MSRKKWRNAQPAKNYMGNAQNNANNGDMTSAEYLKMMEIINQGGQGRGPGSSGKKDVMITLCNLKNDRKRFTFRIYNSPAGMEIKKGDRISLYPKFTDSIKRIYVVKNNNGHLVSGYDSAIACFVMRYCDGEFEYLKKLLADGKKRIEVNWRLDKNVKIPYVDISEGLTNADQN